MPKRVREISLEGPRDRTSNAPVVRPRVSGKFLFVGSRKFYVRGVTYGTFRPGSDGACLYPDPEVAARDFDAMRASGVNTVRTYTPPPRWLLDLAHERDLFVMVGIAWESHVAFLDDRRRAKSIEEHIREAVRKCSGHPAILCYAVGNEIPAQIVRWHGRRRIERFIERLYLAAKREDPAGLVTYVNYPSTEYLHLPFLDLYCFNVFLESEDQLGAYLARLQNVAGGRPLVMAEIGLDSQRHGEDVQAIVLGWQIRAAFAAGCAGAFVFSWTDEWHRGGYDIDDWDFGITDRERRAKPALASVQDAFAAVPLPVDEAPPRVSVVVCTHNGAPTLAECLKGVCALDYPDVEVIVVDDGSTDDSAVIAEEFDVHLIRTENRGLSSARNTGLAAASGEIVAYLDDDARPDVHWLKYLVAAFETSPHAGVGGPNIAPEKDGLVAKCVARAPGSPVHVLLSDEEAEHIPGCNMAFRKERLDEIGGFDPQFRVAGDDVDVCWRLQEKGWTLGFSPAAMVWHHRRNRIRAFWHQQREYGKAEALLERKWPERYNSGGHIAWTGSVYGGAVARPIGRRWRIYYGTWGSNLFQPGHENELGLLAGLPLMPEWYLAIAALAAASVLAFVWRPLVIAVPLLVLAVVIVVLQGDLSARWALRGEKRTGRVLTLRMRAVTTFLYLLQPYARLLGRMQEGLTPWRRHRATTLALPLPRRESIWSEHWKSPEEHVWRLQQALRAAGRAVAPGGHFERWDLHLRVGGLGGARIRTAVEEHGEGKQLVRVRCWPRVTRVALVLVAALSGLVCVAAIDGAWRAFTVLLVVLLGAAGALVVECAAATSSILDAVKEKQREEVAHAASHGSVHEDLIETLRERTETAVALAGSEDRGK